MEDFVFFRCPGDQQGKLVGSKVQIACSRQRILLPKEIFKPKKFGNFFFVFVLRRFFVTTNEKRGIVSKLFLYLKEVL